MIYDRIEKLSMYLPRRIMDRLDPALARLRPDSGDGCEELEGKELFLRVMRYDTRPPEQCGIEAHDAYIDIQMTLFGREGISVFPREELTVLKPYDPASDAVIFLPDGAEAAASFTVRAGEFLLLMPHEAHRAQEQVKTSPQPVRKAVVKLKLSYLMEATH